ncbi:MAG: citrate (Si)-synthase [Bacteroidia bacterium]|nr:citrate (Si)-synthase [Bacteroidia bacterium]
MDQIKKKLLEKGEKECAVVKRLISEFGNVVVESVNIDQILTGMKGMTSLLTVTSKLDPENGIRYRGYSIQELQDKLPKTSPDGEPLPEGLFLLMLLGELPTLEQTQSLSKEWFERSHVPDHVKKVLDAMPLEAKPMTQFSTAIISMATDSLFQKAHRAGISKNDYWDTTYEDVMNLIARLPVVAAYIYRRTFKDGTFIEPDPKLDWAANFAHMMGYDDEEIYRLFRMYMCIHADHEGGNVSAHATHLVGTALSNPYYSYAAGMLGLAGPLHGYANQEVMFWIYEMIKVIGDSDDKEEIRTQIEAYVRKTISEGKVIPGYGHAVLRVTDPRFTAQQQFAEKYVADDKLINIVNMLYDIVPPILKSLGKVKNPWPNVDAFSGALLQHYGISEYFFYTVMFGVSRALGVLAQLIWDRMYNLPLERPSSETLEWFKEKAGI